MYSSWLRPPGFIADSYLLAKNVMKLGGGTGRRRTSNYRATEGISGSGYCIKQEAHIERGQAGSGWLSPDPEPVATSWALSSSTMTAGKIAAPTGASNGTDEGLPSGDVWRPRTGILG